MYFDLIFLMYACGCCVFSSLLALLGDESSAQSFDVIFSFDIKSGMQDKDRLLPFLARAGFSVCNEKHEKMFNFHEIWADTMAVSFVVILLLSHNYEKTEACMMQLHTARLAEKKIIPIKTEEFELTEDSELREFLSDIPSYKVYEDFEENVEKVVGAVKEHINAISMKLTNTSISCWFYLILCACSLHFLN